MTELGYKTLRESIVDIIRKRIINRELQPGQKIVEQELAKEFKTSRAPIREALRELENEGLVEYVRNAGCSVKEITFEELFEIYLMRVRIMRLWQCVFWEERYRKKPCRRWKKSWNA